ncbi:MAG: FAD binding domain-containing protein [Deltaproteobacteria bacterium]|nr:FAD binding domain-containing protein [Deltaproteobacteria bacterium]
MDLNTVTEIRHPANADAITKWEKGYAWLAGGTWLFSEPQIDTHTLIDLDSLKWPSLRPSRDGLEIAATCKINELNQFVEKAPSEWSAVPLFRECCRSFLSSFKIWNSATVGGNICMSLPAGPMISLTGALEGVCELWPRGEKPRKAAVIDFITGNHVNILSPGELLRGIRLPASALKKIYAFRRFTLTQLGRSEVLIIGTKDPEKGDFLLTVTAATVRPIQLSFSDIPDADGLKRAIDDAVPFSLYLDDVHGSPEHRKHLTYYFTEQIRQELSSRNRGHA